MSKEFHTVPDVKAYCYTCGWSCMAKNAHAVGAQHARRKQHTVSVEVRIVYRYDYGEKSAVLS